MSEPLSTERLADIRTRYLMGGEVSEKMVGELLAEISRLATTLEEEEAMHATTRDCYLDERAEVVRLLAENRQFRSALLLRGDPTVPFPYHNGKAGQVIKQRCPFPHNPAAAAVPEEEKPA